MTNPTPCCVGWCFARPRLERSPLAYQVVGAFSPLLRARRTTGIRAFETFEHVSNRR